MYRIINHVTSAGKDIYEEWWRALRDVRTKMAADRRLRRIEAGNFGDHKFCRDGVWELRLDVGPGYRIYYALQGKEFVILLCAGDKSSQNTDITRAVTYLRDRHAEER